MHTHIINIHFPLCLRIRFIVHKYWQTCWI